MLGEMTYLYAFNAEPDGIGVISDTRLTLVSTLGQLRVAPDQVAKVSPLGQRAFVGIAGTIDHAASILDGLAYVLRSSNDSQWHELFVRHCEARLAAYLADGTYSERHPPEVQLIYGDIRHKRGRTKCRLIRLETSNVNGGIKLVRKTATEGQYLAIGWSQEGRRELNAAASDALAEIEGRGLNVSRLPANEIDQIYQHPGEGRGVKLDSSGPRIGNFRSQLRKYSARTFLRNSNVLAVEPVLLYCGIAQAAIEAKAEELRCREVEGINTVGHQWTPASLTLRHGFRAFNDGELVALMPVIRALD